MDLRGEKKLAEEMAGAQKGTDRVVQRRLDSPGGVGGTPTAISYR